MSWEKAEEIRREAALADLLEKAQVLQCVFGNYAPSHGCACNNCDLANALEPWKISVENRKLGE